MNAKKAKIAWCLKLTPYVISVFVLGVLVVGAVQLLLMPLPSSPPQKAFTQQMSDRLAKCDTAQKALQRLDTGRDEVFGLYEVSENYPSSVKGAVFMVMIEAPSGTSPEFSVIVLYPTPEQLHMRVRRREAGGAVKRKAFAVRYIDWDEGEQLPK